MLKIEAPGGNCRRRRLLLNSCGDLSSALLGLLPFERGKAGLQTLPKRKLKTCARTELSCVDLEMGLELKRNAAGADLTG
jgi:hypothetical protein